MFTLASGILRASAVITKTGQTVMGGEINCRGYDYLSLFLNYTKGDETGLDIYPYALQTSSGDEFQIPEWETAAGVYTATAQKIEFTATTKTVVVFDVRGIEIMKFYQGGSANDGTPTGTLAASYTLR